MCGKITELVLKTEQLEGIDQNHHHHHHHHHCHHHHCHCHCLFILIFTELMSRTQQLEGVMHSVLTKATTVSFSIVGGVEQLPNEPEKPS